MRRDKAIRGQSFVELVLALPVIFLLLGGMAEIAFFINVYLDMLDASREGARYGSNLLYTANYLAIDSDGLPPDLGNCVPETTHFYVVIGCLTADNIRRVGNIDFNDTTDDIVISVFSIKSIPVTDPDDYAPTIEARFPDANGYSYTQRDTGVGCSGACPSRISNAQAVALLKGSPNTTGYLLNNGLVLVEIFHDHSQQLNLPFFNLLPNPIHTYAYTFFPLPSAEPTATPLP